jgi:hypothetical protein
VNKVATLSPAERAELFRETGARRGLPGALVEKDFWVCWTLGQLFDMPSLRGHIVFKGGTSLSKVFNAIRRFSEDIDLIVDYEMLGFHGDRHPSRCPSRNKRTALLAEMLAACGAYIEGPFLRDVRERFTSALGPDGWTLATRRTPDGGTVVEFTYPPAVAERVEYVKPIVLLEPGTHAEFIPKGSYRIRSFAAEEYPGLFERADVELEAIRAERTFWEKATILHAEYHRPADKRIGGRHSRHYYDMAMLAAAADVRARALADAALRERVVKHKNEFYYSKWARYDLAVPGTLRLVPPQARLAELRRDYEGMAVMIFGEPPPFDQVMATLADLEREINGGNIQEAR